MPEFRAPRRLFDRTSHTIRTAYLLPAAFGLGLCLSLGAARLEAAPRADLQALLEDQISAALLGSTEAPADQTISLFISGDVDPMALAGLGADLGTVAGGQRIIRLPRASLSALLSLPGIGDVQPARALTPQLNVSVPIVGAQQFWAEDTTKTPPVYAGYSGKNVVIGIVDTGIDVTHLDFALPATGKTRIINLWDQLAATNQPPTGFTYGRLWTAADIDAGLCTETDGDGHGTFIASVAGGNGKATGNSKLPYRYVGVAPEATLIIVKSRGLSTDIVDGVSYVFQRATELGKDAVALIAYGTHSGPHDGTDPMEVALNGLAGPGRIICAAAGNYGATPIHATATVPSGGSASVTFSVPTHGTGGLQRVTVEGWYATSENISVTLRTPSGASVGPVARGASLSQESGQGFVALYNGTTRNARTGDYQIYLNLNRITTDVAAGTWTIQLTTTTAPAPADFWLTDYSLAGGNPVMVGGLSYEKTIVTPATADSVISAGAYCTRPNWVAQNGTTYGFGGAILDEIASWSSKGPRRDGLRVVPDLTGPGLGVGAAKSKYSTVSSIYILDDGVHAVRQGSSAAAAHVAGCVALMLQRERETNHAAMSVAKVRNFFRLQAHTDAFTGTGSSIPNSDWGYGKLNIAASIVGVESGPLASLRLSAPYPNPTRSAAAFSFTLAPGDLADPSTGVLLQILDIRGRLVSSIAGARIPGPQQLVWSGADQRGQRVAPGVYLARLAVGSRTAMRKVAVLSP